jgi:hypothetical protein
VANTAQRTRLTVAWYGGRTRDLEVLTGPGHRSRIGADLGEVRWVHVHDGTGTHRDAYCVTTDLTMKPQPIVEDDPQRWAIDTTFQACREDLTLESTQGSGHATVFRLTPGVFGLSTTIVLL